MSNLVKNLVERIFLGILLSLVVFSGGCGGGDDSLFETYVLQIQKKEQSPIKPKSPSKLILDSSLGLADNKIPTIVVTVSKTGGYVTLYSDKTCKTAVSSAVLVEDTTAPYKVNVKTQETLKEGFYNFYAKHDDSSCSQSVVNYAYFKTLEKFRGASIFRGLLLQPNTKPFLVDYDKDGDLDIIVGQRDGTLRYFEKGDLGFFEEKMDSHNPFNNIKVKAAAAPFLKDYTGDGRLELIVGGQSGKIFYYVRNEQDSVYIDKTQDNANPFKDIKVFSDATPFFENLDNDEDLELIVGDGNGKLNYYQKNNLGFYVKVSNDENPFRNVLVFSYAVPFLSDLDNDSNLELIVGTGDGELVVYNKDMTNTYVLQSNGHPFSRINRRRAAPFLTNLDDDSDLELILGETNGILSYYDKNSEGNYINKNQYYSPMNKIDLGGNTAPFLVNLDQDSDLELVVANNNGILNVVDKNSENIYVVQSREKSPFNSISILPNSIINFANLDDDSSLELLVGRNQGSLRYFDQDTDGVYVSKVNHPLNKISIDAFIAPFLANVDDDDELELILGSESEIRYYDLSSDNIYVEQTGNKNPFKKVNAEENNIVPFLADFDNDKKLELLVGRLDGTLDYYKKKGIYYSEQSLIGIKNFFRDIHVGSRAVPAYGDLDGDGRPELILGNDHGYLHFAIPYKNNGRWVAFY